jgi:hypothetical protein
VFIAGSPLTVVAAAQAGLWHESITSACARLDIGYVDSSVIMWAAIATTDLKPGSLGGTYVGVTGGAAVGFGGGANVLVGGFNNSVSLQRVSVEGSMGVNVAGGIASITIAPGP